MTPVFLSLFALLSGCAMIVSATGLLGTTLALRTGEMGFPVAVTGAVMAAYFVGFVLGTYICPRIIGQVGHIRAFAVFAAMASASVLVHAMIADPLSWTFLRFLTGGCVVGVYMVIESWLNEKATNRHRGRALALYQVISLASLGLGQWFLFFESASPVTPFLVCGALFAVGLVPIALTQVPEPAPITHAALDMRYLWATSPLGVLGAFTAALANGVLFALGPIFAQNAGLSVQQIALFMSLTILGGVALQWPIGHLSDHRDRRTLILLAATIAGVTAALSGLLVDRSLALFFAGAFLYGGFTFSIYPLCVAHSNDHVPPHEYVRTAGGLLLVYGIGAAIGPFLVGLLMGTLGYWSFFTFLLATHIALAASALYRMVVSAAPGIDEQEPFVMLSRTSQSALSMVRDAAERKP